MRARQSERSYFSRRQLLRGFGAAAALSPFLPMLEAQADNEVPKRLVLFFSPNGTIYEKWKPSGSETNFALGPILEPLNPYKSELLILDGLQLTPGHPHVTPFAGLWTGAPLLPGPFVGGDGASTGFADGISVDQTVAQTTKDKTQFGSLEFGVGRANSNDNIRHMIYAESNQPIPAERHPQAMFDRVFGNFDPGQDNAELDRIKAQRKSVIDMVKSDLDTVQSKVGVDDRIKIDAHLNGIREVEKRLTAVTPNTCELPPFSVGFDPMANDHFPAAGKLQMDILALALACDRTRVASLQWSRAVSGTTHTWLGHSTNHHQLSHDNNRPLQTEINIWYAKQFAYLLEALKSRTDVDGSSLLDNTMAVWGNELADGALHSVSPAPFVVAGRAGGYLKPGRFLQFPKDTQHHRLLVSMCHAMGLEETTKYGKLDQGNGPLLGLT